MFDNALSHRKVADDVLNAECWPWWETACDERHGLGRASSRNGRQ